MTTFTVTTVSGDGSDSDTYEADSFEALCKDLVEDFGEAFEEEDNIREEGDGSWSVWNDDLMHYITRVD